MSYYSDDGDAAAEMAADLDSAAEHIMLLDELIRDMVDEADNVGVFSGGLLDRITAATGGRGGPLPQSKYVLYALRSRHQSIIGDIDAAIRKAEDEDEAIRNRNARAAGYASAAVMDEEIPF